MIKKKEFNGQYKFKLKDTIIKRDTIQPKKLVKKEIPSKLKVNLSSSLKYISKKKNYKRDKDPTYNLYPTIISKNLQKYNSSTEIKNVMIINNLINCRSSHFLAIFKDYLISDYIEEFLRRIYFINESIERIPKLYNYYKNYLVFFCKPTFIDSFSNDIIKNYGDLNAECFYKNNLEKKKNRHEAKRYLDKKIEEKDKNKNNDNEELIKTVFTKSIKNSIDNIDEEDINNNNLIINDFSNKIPQDSLGNTWGNDTGGNLISEGNSLLLMINEIKDQKITEKTIKMTKNISSNNSGQNDKKNVPIVSSYKTLNTEKKNNILYKENNTNITNNSNNNNSNKTYNKFNIIKTNTYTKSQNLDSIQNMVYSPKSKKNAVFSIKKDKNTIDKNDRLLSPKMKTLTQSQNSNNNTITNTKNHNSIVVNINININTNQNNNNINNNFKSPVHITKKRFPLSPLSPINLNLLNEKVVPKKEIPLSTTRNKETEKIKNKIEESNFVKIVKKKNDYNNLLLSNKRNKKIVDINRVKSINSIEANEYKNKQNYSCNKEMVLYHKRKSPKKIKYQSSEYSINKENKEIFSKNINNNTLNKNVYFSPKKMGYKPRYTNSMKELDNVNEINNKKFVYHKKQNNINNTINSPLNKKAYIEKKFFSYKRIENLNGDLNVIKDE